MAKIEDAFDTFYNEFKDWTKKQILHRTFDIILNDTEEIGEKDKEINRLKEIAHKMHTWIFLHSGDEQKVYDELGLTDEENARLGDSGQFRIGSDKNEN